MKTATVLTHAEFEGPSRIAALLGELDYQIEIRSLHRGDPVPSACPGDDLLVVMGGPMGVGDLDNSSYPYLRAEVRLLRQRIADDQPVLGICLGAQLLAYAGGARVYPMTTADGRARLLEVGWGPIHLESGSDDVLSGLPTEMTVLHWHGDTFDLPDRATLLTSGALCKNQGFRLRRRLFGLQFHVESTIEDVENFLREDRDFVTRAHGETGVDRLRRETLLHFPAFREAGDRMLRRILRAATSGERH